MTGELSKHLSEIDTTASKRVNDIITQLAKSENVPIHYDGKIEQLEWVQLMNNYKNIAEEIIFKELIYC